MGALQCTEGQVPSTEEPVSAMGRRGLRGPQMHWCQDPRHTMSCAGLSGTEGDVRDRDRVRKMEPEIETEKWRQRKTERERHRDGDRERRRCRETRKTGGEREGGRISRPPGSPSSSLSISTFQPKGAFLTPALTLESQVLHSVSRK